MKKIIALAAAMVAFLSACGGGDGPAGTNSPPQEQQPTEETDPDPNPDPNPDPAPDAPPASEPDPETASIRSTLNALIRSSNTVTEASAIDGNAFFWRPTAQATPASLDLDDITKRDAEFQDIGSRRGVSRGSIPDSSTVDYGGWMTHSFFLVNTWNPSGSDPLRPTESTFTEVYSIGAASGSNPVSGSAEWTGVMAGIDEDDGASTFGNLVTGDASITIDSFSSPSLDIALSSITDASTGGRHSDIVWNNVSLSGGAFARSDLSGRFYGPNHEEVGGIFLRNRISGAFGANRQ